MYKPALVVLDLCKSEIGFLHLSKVPHLSLSLPTIRPRHEFNIAFGVPIKASGYFIAQEIDAKSDNGRSSHPHLHSHTHPFRPTGPKIHPKTHYPPKNAAHYLFDIRISLQSSASPGQPSSNPGHSPIMVSPSRCIINPLRDTPTITAPTKTTYTQLPRTKRAWCTVARFWYSGCPRIQHRQLSCM